MNLLEQAPLAKSHTIQEKINSDEIVELAARSESARSGEEITVKQIQDATVDV